MNSFGDGTYVKVRSSTQHHSFGGIEHIGSPALARFEVARIFGVSVMEWIARLSCKSFCAARQGVAPKRAKMACRAAARGSQCNPSPRSLHRDAIGRFRRHPPPKIPNFKTRVWSKSPRMMQKLRGFVIRVHPTNAKHKPLRLEKERLLRRLCPPQLVVFLGFLQRNQTVTIRIDLLEFLGRAEKFALRHLAVAVAVHLAEPKRPLGRNRPVLLHPIEANRDSVLAI